MKLVCFSQRGTCYGKPGNLFDPKGLTTRAEVAAILYRYLGGANSASDAPVVYMTADISPDGLMAIYEALDWTPGSHVAVKLSTGEPGSNYLRTDLIGPLVQSLDSPTIVECNTAYGGSRANTAMHYQVAADHGYTAIADVDIMDEDGSMLLSPSSTKILFKRRRPCFAPFPPGSHAEKRSGLYRCSIGKSSAAYVAKG